MKKLFIFVCVAVFVATSCAEKKDEVKVAKGLDDLNGNTLAVLTGSLDDLVMSEKYPEVKLLRLNTMPEIITAVENNRADFCIGDDVLFMGGELEGRGLVLSFFSDVVAGDIGIAFRLNETDLCKEFNEFLANLKNSGMYDDMKHRWCESDVSNMVLPELHIKEGGRHLRVAISPLFPFEYMQNGVWIGFEIEMMTRFASEYGYEIEFLNYDFSAMVAALNTNKVDAIGSFMTITEERSKQVLFSDSYFYSETAVYGRSSSLTEGVKEKKSMSTALKNSVNNNLILESRWKLFIDGLWETLVISFFSIILGTVIGAFVCWMRMGKRKVLRKCAEILVDIVRGVPILVFLMIMFYVVFASSHITARWVAIIAFAINFGAYVSEMFRTGIQGVDKGQTEAGLAMGFGVVGTFAFFVLPQAVKNILPVYKGEAVSLIKNTSIVGYIAIQDLTKISDIVRSRTFDAFFPLILISVIYFVFAWLLGKGLDKLNNSIK